MSRILIAEDESRIAVFLERGLRANGFTTALAVDGHEALVMARSGEFDLLVLDLGLPDLDGLEVLQRLRVHDRRLPVLILTARDGVADTVVGGRSVDLTAREFTLAEVFLRHPGPGAVA